MIENKGKTLEEILGNLELQEKEMVEKLRAVVKKTLPEVVETIKWGNITYLLKGKNLAWIVIYKDHVDFGFFMGVKLNSKALKGTGKGLRHIKIEKQDDIKGQELARLLKDAAKLV